MFKGPDDERNVSGSAEREGDVGEDCGGALVGECDAFVLWCGEVEDHDLPFVLDRRADWHGCGAEVCYGVCRVCAVGVLKGAWISNYLVSALKECGQKK